jgi:mannose-1-phosphate guanylyltransferase
MESSQSTINNSNHHYIAIMAGGVGSRFWPSSTESKPKQFLDILGIGRSLMQMTYDRCLKIVPNENILIVTNQSYKALIQEQLPDLPVQNILCEPSRNNTAPCVAYTALHINARDKDAVFAVLPSDHVILKEQEYLDRLSQAFQYAKENEVIVTLGIQATRPDTGYGYIEMNKSEMDKSSLPHPILKVSSFKEKPSKEIAEGYLSQGNYLWNAGMFVWSVSTILNSFNKNEPEILNVLMEDASKYATADEQSYIDQVYPNTKKISVDYAILEKADNVYTIPADIGWSDLGTWNSLHAYIDKNENECAVIGEKTYLIDTKNTIVRSDSTKIVVIKGLDDYIVVDEPEALLIYPKSEEQEIKQVVRDLEA